ncbi:DUF2637 domain-containing protein [Streptomyces sp. NPDC094038]|uniref:DUF2637 domain-containing protein n=1 Tax=Streptomyces sp. NPDC094038 TaxID=3366055 RepID=UPI0038242B10
MAAPLKLTRTHRILIGVVVAGAMVIAGIGFAGSYAAVRELAIKKGFGNFSYFFPIGIDAGICVLLALDLLLTWIRMPFPLLRQTAWLLTVATVAFNAAAATDPLGRAMHAVIPVLFVVTVEAARHAVGRIADITADKHMEGVRLTRWLLSPVPTFLLWRRMKLWELRSYDQVIKLEQERLVYQARLRSRFGRAWRRKAPVESLMPLRLARYGVPLADTAPEGLAAAGIEIPVLLPAPAAPAPAPAVPQGEQRPELISAPRSEQPAYAPAPEQASDPEVNPWLHARNPQQIEYHGSYNPDYVPPNEPQYVDEQLATWQKQQQYQQEQYEREQYEREQYEQFQQQFPQDQQEQFQQEQLPQEPQPVAEESVSETTGSFPIPSGPGRTRELGEGGGPPEPTEEDFYLVFKKSIDGGYPSSSQFRGDVEATFGTTLPQRDAERMVNRFTNRHTAELQEDHIA